MFIKNTKNEIYFPKARVQNFFEIGMDLSFPKYKVAYNTCYGGFTLSKKARDMLRDAGHTDEELLHLSEIPRHDPDLIRVVEELGEEANGEFSEIKIKTIKGNRYRIHEYDGLERVITPEDERYVVIDPN